MVFYSLSDSTFTRLYREEVDTAFSALECILNREKGIYASAELTTGRRLYNAFREFHVKTVDELKALKEKENEKDWYGRNIWAANVKSARDFAAEIRDKIGVKTLVITPAPFSARGWTQPEYLAFWEQLLRTRIKATWFKADWQYSNGCTFEFAVSADAGLPTFDHQGKPLSVQQAAEMIDAAIRDLDLSGFDTSKLRENLSRLHPIAARA
jgi:hypothetical protein